MYAKIVFIYVRPYQKLCKLRSLESNQIDGVLDDFDFYCAAIHEEHSVSLQINLVFVTQNRGALCNTLVCQSIWARSNSHMCMCYDNLGRLSNCLEPLVRAAAKPAS